VYPRIHF